MSISVESLIAQSTAQANHAAGRAQQGASSAIAKAEQQMRKAESLASGGAQADSELSLEENIMRLGKLNESYTQLNNAIGGLIPGGAGGGAGAGAAGVPITPVS